MLILPRSTLDSAWKSLQEDKTPALSISPDEFTQTLTLWRPLLPMDTAMHPVPDRVKPSFVIFDIRALWRSALSVRVPGCQKLHMTAWRLLCVSDRHIQTVWILCHWLAMTHCCCNPIVYCWMNDKFRTGFRRLFSCLPCVVAPPDEDGTRPRITHAQSSSTTLATSDLSQANYSGTRRVCVSTVSYSVAASTVSGIGIRTVA